MLFCWLILFLYCFCCTGTDALFEVLSLCGFFFFCSVGVKNVFNSVNEHITQWKATFRLPKHDRMVYSHVNNLDTLKILCLTLKENYILTIILDDILILLILTIKLTVLFSTVFWSLFGPDVVYFEEGV